MRTYKENFLKEHYERIIWLLWALVLGILLIVVGKEYLNDEKLIGEGITLVIAVGTIAINKARTPKQKNDENNSENHK